MYITYRAIHTNTNCNFYLEIFATCSSVNDSRVDGVPMIHFVQKSQVIHQIKCTQSSKHKAGVNGKS